MDRKQEIGQAVSRLPGQSLRERRDERFDDESLFPLCAFMGGVVLLVVEWLHVYGGLKPSIWIGVVAFFASLAFCVWSVFKVRRWMRAFRQGERGERIVAQAIQRDLAPKGYVAFHDLQLAKDGRAFNIDHLVIGENGIFAIETKNYTKPDKGSVEVRYDGRKVLWNGARRKDEDRQAMAAAKAAKELIDEATGLRVFVTPVLCAVGWYATSSDLYGNPVLLCMEKTLKSVIPKAQPRARLEEADRNKIISALDRLQ